MKTYSEYLNIIMSVVILLLAFRIHVLSKNEDVKTPVCYNQEYIEGILTEVKHQDGKAVLVFERTVQLGTHEVFPGEWNCVKVNSRGYVEEVFVGEDWKQQVIESQ
jgi:hypothetical protein